MITVYGIPNCNTVKKAITWLDQNKIAYQFHDYKKAGITATKLKQWSEQVSWEKLLNKKGTTWRALDSTIQAGVINEKTAIKVMEEHTSTIKRPVIEKGNKVVAVGFDENEYAHAFKK